MSLLEKIKTFYGEYAAIEYHGQYGITQDCLNAIVRLIHFGDNITSAKLLTQSGRHCFLLTINEHDLIAIKSGFSSGYSGEGPRGLSAALQILLRHGIEIYEYAVPRFVLDRIDGSRLLKSDIDNLENMRPLLPHKYHDYIWYDAGKRRLDEAYLSSLFPKTLPLAALDLRLVDLALEYEENPDAAVLKAYRRLEDIVREKTDIKDESGAKLFSKSFHGEDSILVWKNIDSGESKGRASLFTGAYMAYRNPRAHRESANSEAQTHRAFLLLNELYLLESETSIRQTL